MESCSLYVHIYIFVLFFLKRFFAHGPIESELLLNRSISSIYGALTGTTNPDQSGPGSNWNEGVLYSPQISRIGVSSSDAVWCYTEDID